VLELGPLVMEVRKAYLDLRQVMSIWFGGRYCGVVLGVLGLEAGGVESTYLVGGMQYWVGPIWAGADGIVIGIVNSKFSKLIV
jgi:hypothetical protein